MYLKWYAPCCQTWNISIDFRHHQMDSCKCGGSGCDFETYQLRWSGDVIATLKDNCKEAPIYLDYNFFDEIILCMSSQDIRFNKVVIDLGLLGKIETIDVEEIKQLEDEMLEDLK